MGPLTTGALTQLRAFFTLNKSRYADYRSRVLYAGLALRGNAFAWFEPILTDYLTNKKDGGLRPCIDYRKINALTRKNRYPLLRIDELQDRPGGSVWFTAIDV